jgi:nucleotide-binding universal stress UspA family protein
MFKHILIATDGSTLAKKAEEGGIAFAKATGARVTGYYALEEPHFRHGKYVEINDQIGAELEHRARESAEKHVAAMAAAAKAAGVPFEPLIARAEMPSRGIIEAARERDCDAIFIASHGRGGLPGLVLGSVTQEVLAHSSTPVLVFR